MILTEILKWQIILSPDWRSISDGWKAEPSYWDSIWIILLQLNVTDIAAMSINDSCIIFTSRYFLTPGDSWRDWGQLVTGWGDRLEIATGEMKETALAPDWAPPSRFVTQLDPGSRDLAESVRCRDTCVVTSLNCVMWHPSQYEWIFRRDFS